MNCPGSRQPQISIHAPREGSDCDPDEFFEDGLDFNPRSPRGERRFQRRLAAKAQTISIHAPREGSDDEHERRFVLGHISIHAPREGSDKKENENERL